VPVGDHEPEMCRSRVSSSKESNKVCQELGWKTAQFCFFSLATAKHLDGPGSQFSLDVSFKVDDSAVETNGGLHSQTHQKNVGLIALAEP